VRISRCYCGLLQLQSPMQIMMAVDTDQKVELETMIKDLEEENRSVEHSLVKCTRLACN